MKKILICTVLFVSILLINSSCEQGHVVKQSSNSGAKQIGGFFKIPLNANGLTGEQQNIFDRLVVTTDPTKVLWIHLIALDGKIIRRMPVVCKITSSGKRLEPTTCSGTLSVNSNEGNYYPKAGIGNYETSEFLQPDGTYGSSDSYVFWFDPMHRYHQYGTAGGIGYLLTDYPIDLSNPLNEITGLYNVHKAASMWQKEQESQLQIKEKEGKIEWEKRIKAMEEKLKQDSIKENKKN